MPSNRLRSSPNVWVKLKKNRFVRVISDFLKNYSTDWDEIFRKGRKHVFLVIDTRWSIFVLSFFFYWAPNSSFDYTKTKHHICENATSMCLYLYIFSKHEIKNCLTYILEPWQDVKNCYFRHFSPSISIQPIVRSQPNFQEKCTKT